MSRLERSAGRSQRIPGNCSVPLEWTSMSPNMYEIYYIFGVRQDETNSAEAKSGRSRLLGLVTESLEIGWRRSRQFVELARPSRASPRGNGANYHLFQFARLVSCLRDVIERQ